MVTVNVTGTMPASGLFAVFMHLDYGLKKTDGYVPIISSGAQSPAQTILNLTNHNFAVMGDLTDTQTVQNQNVFKSDPGFTGLVTDINTDDPVEGVTVQFFDPKGKLLGTTQTDENGYYFFYHKHTGRRATYTVVLPDYGLQESVVLKAVKFVFTEFQIDP